jgi:hypothetical protein
VDRFRVNFRGVNFSLIFRHSDSLTQLRGPRKTEAQTEELSHTESEFVNRHRSTALLLAAAALVAWASQTAESIIDSLY